MRRADFDMLAHANNAALWAAVDDEATRRLGAAPIGRALVEHLDEAVPGTAIEIGSQTQEGGIEIWLRSAPATHQAATHQPATHQPVTHLAGLLTTR
jgi:acyl-ACP thioesterase